MIFILENNTILCEVSVIELISLKYSIVARTCKFLLNFYFYLLSKIPSSHSFSLCSFSVEYFLANTKTVTKVLLYQKKTYTSPVELSGGYFQFP